MAAAITMPTANKVQANLMAYAAGIVSGVGFKVALPGHR
jgi:hypothetical protein